jgi:hypothetical protein
MAAYMLATATSLAAASSKLYLDTNAIDVDKRYKLKATVANEGILKTCNHI